MAHVDFLARATKRWVNGDFCCKPVAQPESKQVLRKGPALKLLPGLDLTRSREHLIVELHRAGHGFDSSRSTS
jgi:hypothetical protein